jgi:hypothetical protein
MQLDLTVQTKEGGRPLAFQVQRLVCAGWVGRDEEALQAHIRELEEIGIPGPARTPIQMNFSTHLVCINDAVDVISAESSGEVEYVVLLQEGQTYIGVGSDHTDRGFERHSIPASKHMYPKVLAPVVWPYSEIRDHWDSIILRSWTDHDGGRVLYQEDPLASILDPDTILAAMPKDDGLTTEGMVVFSGTVASKAGMIYGSRFDFEMEDPVLHRSISYGYKVRVLPQYI